VKTGGVDEKTHAGRQKTSTVAKKHVVRGKGGGSKKCVVTVKKGSGGEKKERYLLKINITPVTNRKKKEKKKIPGARDTSASRPLHPLVSFTVHHYINLKKR
jgi:hypothetical protein